MERHPVGLGLDHRSSAGPPGRNGDIRSRPEARDHVRRPGCDSRTPGYVGVRWRDVDGARPWPTARRPFERGDVRSPDPGAFLHLRGPRQRWSYRRRVVDAMSRFHRLLVLAGLAIATGCAGRRIESVSPDAIPELEARVS